MSTRSVIEFYSQWDQEQPAAIIYRHTDGYPEGMLPDLDRFFTEVEAQTKDTRFSDASYLAAKFVVWQAAEYSYGKPLDFLSVGVVREHPGDIEFVYRLRCRSTGRPVVEHEGR